MLARISILITGLQVRSTPYVLLTRALPRRFLQDSRVNTLKAKLRTTIVPENTAMMHDPSRLGTSQFTRR